MRYNTITGLCLVDPGGTNIPIKRKGDYLAYFVFYSNFEGIKYQSACETTKSNGHVK
jgi:hypothetical protein